MTDEPKLWRDIDDTEKGALLLAHHRGETIQFYSLVHYKWRKCKSPSWVECAAYRVKPKPPVVETVEYLFSFIAATDPSDFHHIEPGHFDGCQNLTIKATVTDGRVTACETIIHD